MPELPEVETTLRGIEPYIMEKNFFGNHKESLTLRWPVPEEIHKKLKNQVIDRIQRRGKYLLLQVSKEYLIIHLGMSGSLRISKQADIKKHDHIDLCFEDGTYLEIL